MPPIAQLVFFGKGYPGNTNIPVAQEIDGNGQPAAAFFASVGTFAADCEGCFNLDLRKSAQRARRRPPQALISSSIIAWTCGTTRCSGTWSATIPMRTRLRCSANKFDGAGIYGGGGFVNPLAGLTQPKLHFTAFRDL